MTSPSLGTLRAQVSNLNRECARLRAELDAANMKIRLTKADHVDFVDKVLISAPECWVDETDPATVVALDYVASLEGQGGGMNGHREGCRCYS